MHRVDSSVIKQHPENFPRELLVEMAMEVADRMFFDPQRPEDYLFDGPHRRTSDFHVPQDCEISLRGYLGATTLFKGVGLSD
jgi:hypothetical protein